MERKKKRKARILIRGYLSMNLNLYTNMLNVITLFSGYDSQCLALRRLGIDFDLVAWSEIDKAAIKAHDVLFPEFAGRNLGDVSKIDWSQIHESIDLLTYSSPCFVAGTLILTDNGYLPIEELNIGHKVLTHSNHYHPIVRVGNKPSNDIIHIKGMMFDEIDCTGNHPFYARELYRYGHKAPRMFHEPKWIEARNLTKKHYLGYAINQKSCLPQWNGSIDNRWGHGKLQNKLQPLFDKSDFWYLMGRYVGDGWKKNNKTGNGIIICHSERNKESLYAALNNLDINYYSVKERTVTKVTICMNELNDFVSRYGYYAHGKKIDGETLNLPTYLLRSFIDGLIDSDGCYTNNEYKISTVSRSLAYGIAQCVAKVYHRHCKVNKSIRNKTHTIEGRIVNQRDTYSVSWHPDVRKQDHAFYEDGIIWFPISKIDKTEKTEIVYNIEVDEDHTYTANGAIVHNCQDFSQAGLQRGGEAGSGTRSSLIWEVERAIDALHPRYLLLENVAALVGEKFLPLFGRWCRLLESKGYHNTWQVLNAKHYGVPQNRERVFLVSKYQDETPYYFPQPFRLDKRLRDVLEDSVPESYYLSDERVQSLLEHKQRQEAAGNGFGFKPKTKDSEYAGAITTMAGLRQCDNYIAGPLVIGSMQRNAYVGSTEGVAPCINAACGMGGGQTPMVTEPLSDRQANKQYHIDEDGSIHGTYRGAKNQTHNISEEQYIHPNAIAPTVTSNGHGKVIVEPRVQQVGNIVSTGNWDNPQRGRIYGIDGIAPALNTEAGGNLRPKIITVGNLYDTPNGGKAAGVVLSDEGIAGTQRAGDNWKVATCAVRGRGEHNTQQLEIGGENTSNAITTVAKDSMVVERQVLGWTRDEKGNVIDRHPVEVANCVTAAKRDNTQNFVKEKSILANTEGFSTPYESKEVSPTIKASSWQYNNAVKEVTMPADPQIIEDFYASRDPRTYDDAAPTIRSERQGLKVASGIRIRRLTERELYRLMDVDDKDIDMLLKTDIARTQHAKLTGNSVVVSVLYHIFRTLLVDTAPAGGEQLKLF